MTVSAPLLITKLYFPPARTGLVSRRRLVNRLAEGLRGPLTLISAPAGSGKTTLLSEWRSGVGAGMPAAWISLDPADNDLSLFLQYLADALDPFQPGIALALQPLLQASEKPSAVAILTHLVNILAGVSQDFAVILDDYHIIEASDIHAALTFLLVHLPPRMHLVILTRSDPPLPLARLRASGQLTEIRAEHLRFSLEEAAHFLNQIMGLNLTDEQVADLEKRTEGWIAGLQLAALSMQRRSDIQSFVSAFSGSHQYIVDYLAEEVLKHQPEAVQSFLIETSILDRMNAPLCTAVTGVADAQKILEYLERANLFLIPLGEDRTWYRYHHLFADQLRLRLRHLRAAQEPILYKRASDWCAQQQWMDEAITYALRANDFERAAPLIEQHVEAVMIQGRVETIKTWLKALPIELVTKLPRLGLSLAWAVYSDYKFDQSEALIHQVEQNMAPEDAPLYQGVLALWRGIIARRHCNLDQSRDFLQQALKQLPAQSDYLRGRAWLFLGLVYLESDVNKALQAFQQTISTFEAIDQLQKVLPAMYRLAWAQMLQGRLTEAESTCQRALRITEQMPYWPVTGYAHFAATELFCERNELERAEQHAAWAAELAQLAGHSDNILIATLEAAHIARARGHWDQAQALIAKAEELARPTIPWMKVQVMEEQINLFLAQGKFSQAERWLERNQISIQPRSMIPELHQQILWARLKVALGAGREMLEQLDLLQAKASSLGTLRWVIQMYGLQALVLQNLGKTREALDLLRAALDLAEPEGSIQVFLELGQPMAEFLALAQQKGCASEFTRRLAAAFSRQRGGKTLPSTTGQALLSQRELELLSLIAAGYSNKEIANELVIALGTVKRHTVNIFTKLDVKNRTEAVAKARELGLL